MFYAFRFNAALAAMNIDPLIVPPSARQEVQAYGEKHGLTPHEAALLLVAKFFGLNLPLSASVAQAVEIWTHTRKIFPNKPEVQEALIDLHLF